MDKESQSKLKNLFEVTRKKCIATCEYYGGSKDTMDVRHLEKLDRILDAESFKEAELLARKAEDCVFTTCLSLWGKGKIRGPNSVELWENKANKAESLARYFEKQAQDKHVICEPGAKEKMLAKAQKQKYRAEKLREYALVLRNNPTAPQPDFSVEEEEVPAEVPAPKKQKKGTKAPPTPPPAPAPIVAAKPKRKVVGLVSKRKRTA